MNSSVDGDPLAGTLSADTAVGLGRAHARRLRDIYRSAGWPCQDSVEVDLLAAGLLLRLATPDGHEKLRLTDAGIAHLARAFQSNRAAMSAHDALVDRIARDLLRDGRVVWTRLSVRARLPCAPEEAARWKVCKPDVFSIRNTSVAAYLQPVVHEIKVSRADLIGDLKCRDKRDAYLDLGGQCWYVLGSNHKGQPIGRADEVPPECGVMHVAGDGRVDVLRHAPQRAVADLPFALWMALAKATPLPSLAWSPADDPDQALLVELDAP
jgi:hypothetical protein